MAMLARPQLCPASAMRSSRIPSFRRTYRLFESFTPAVRTRSRPSTSSTPQSQVNLTVSCGIWRHFRCYSTTTPAQDRREEETLPDYDPSEYLPIETGQVLDDRYEVVAKLGYGSNSTVWLAKNRQREIGNFRDQFAVLKVMTRQASDLSLPSHEVRSAIRLAYYGDVHHNSMRLADDDVVYDGKVRIPLETFSISYAGVDHMCLVFEPLKQPLPMWKERFNDGKMQFWAVLPLIGIVLGGLHHIHASGMIHTDFKPENISLRLENHDELHEIARLARHETSHVKRQDRKIFESYPMGWRPGERPGQPVITGLGRAVSIGSHTSFRIQPDRLRAPEVTLGAEWGTAVDIWSCGVMAWDLLEAKPLFDATDPKTGSYSPTLHLAEMIALMGPPPKQFLDRCRLAGKYFDAEGNFKDNAAVVPRSLEDTITTIHGEEKREVLRFLRRMLVWDPEQRPSAVDLQGDQVRSLLGSTRIQEYMGMAEYQIRLTGETADRSP